MNIPDALIAMIAQMNHRPIHSIRLDSKLTQQGIDSLSLVIFRENCEQEFGITIPDEDWTSFSSVERLSEYISSRSAAAEEMPQHHVGDMRQRTALFANDDDMFEEIRIGMPLMGINNLSENALLKYLGDLRWRHISQLTGVQSKDITNDKGQRLYPAFFFVETDFPEPNTMATFGENDRLTIVDAVQRFGGSMLDGTSYIIPTNTAEALRSPFQSSAEARERQIPSVRMTNVFVMQFDGAEWLKKSRPGNYIEGIRMLAEPPESYLKAKAAEQRSYMDQPGETYIRLTPAESTFHYNVQPDRDVNGVGLLYFANYCLFLDLAERAALGGGRWPWEEQWTNKRSVVRRTTAYFNNASWRDQLTIHTEIWLQNPYHPKACGDPALTCPRIHTNQTMYRASDGRTMCISSALKTIHGLTADEIPWIKELRGVTAEQR